MAATEGNTLLQPLEQVLCPDPSRVALRPFTPAENDGGDAFPRPRVERIAERVLSLGQEELAGELARIMGGLFDRHGDLERVLLGRFHDLAEPAISGRETTREQKLVIGGYFVEEYSLESAALFNPSAVLHPDQSGIPAGSVRLVLSLRGVGEGHVSSISFRTGVFGSNGSLSLDEPTRRPASPLIEAIPGGAPDDPGTRLQFGEDLDLSQLVIFPVTYRQRGGLEDLRLVRFTDEDGHATYLGTYTAFSGERIRQELMRTDDFRTFEMNALQGPLSETKGMALFSRRVGGQFAMLGRHDHENIWLLFSRELYRWDAGEILLRPRWPWEFIQIGNCGPPIEIDEGWLVLTHGVGTFMTYC
ncbi:MAG TPA: hypothetical protein VML55_14665, partial [Planctomycetaceae bacterium]|nr:hypothetical protein [Planctomycetaceae bacterium]